MSWIDGNNYIDSKTNSSGYTYFRTGQGTEPGSQRTWMTVQASNGNVGIGTTAPTSALHVSGDATVTGDVFLTGADCAEQFNIAGAQLPELGTVVVIDDSGALRESREPYDKKVAGVISGAGGCRPGLVLDNRPSEEPRVTLALVGKVFCKSMPSTRLSMWVTC